MATGGLSEFWKERKAMKKSFTLIELLIVIAIISLLAALIFVILSSVRKVRNVSINSASAIEFCFVAPS